ncbi:MAG: PorV/PorQ family protein [Candidatus Firestonebacteria bacterium]
MQLQKAAVIFLICLNVTFAFMDKDDAGTVAAQFLKLGVGARATGMGNAYGGVSDDSTGIYWNPAGLNQIKAQTMNFTHAFWFEDIFYDWASVALSTDMGKIGFGIEYLSYGNIIETDDTGWEIGDFKPMDLAVIVSYANVIEDIMFGLNVKYISMRIKESATAIGMDFGIMKSILMDSDKINSDKINIGLVVQNIGTNVQFISDKYSLPLNIKLGLACYIESNWIFSVDFNIPVDNAVNFGVGAEYKYKLNDEFGITCRAGCQSLTTEGLNGLTVGGGVNYLNWTIDYAFVPYGDLGSTHRFSLGFLFGEKEKTQDKKITVPEKEKPKPVENTKQDKKIKEEIAKPVKDIKQDKKITIAIVDFYQSKKSTEYLRGVLSNSDNLFIMKRDEMIKILKKESECFEINCALDIGRNLKVDKIIVGSVKKQNNKLSVNVKLIDIKRSTLLFDRTISNIPEKDLIVTIEKIGKEIQQKLK